MKLLIFLLPLFFWSSAKGSLYQAKFHRAESFKAVTIEDMESIPFAAGKSEILALFGPPERVVPAQRSWDGEIWSYISYGFAFAFDESGRLSAKRFDLYLNESLDRIALIKRFSRIQLFNNCEPDYEIDHFFEKSFFYDPDSGAIFDLTDPHVQVVWREKDIASLKSRTVGSCASVSEPNGYLSFSDVSNISLESSKASILTRFGEPTGLNSEVLNNRKYEVLSYDVQDEISIRFMFDSESEQLVEKNICRSRGKHS